MPLLPYSAFAEIFEPYAGTQAGYVQGWFGNAGDALIHFGTLELFKAFNISVHVLNEKEPFLFTLPAQDLSAIFFFGGGSMGYRGPSMLLRQKARNFFQNSPVPRILLPQSWRGPEDDSLFSKMYARENLTPPGHAHLAPDLALAYTVNFDIPPPARPGVGIWLRRDGESNTAQVSTELPDPITGLHRYSAVEYIQRAAIFPALITDRLHMAIAGLLAQRSVVLLPNNYPKNRGVFECWLKNLGASFAPSIDEALRLLAST